MTIITGNFQEENQQWKFDADDIKEFVRNEDLTDAQLQEIADILAANVEIPSVNAEGCVEIDRSNFNDSFRDMEEDMQVQYFDIKRALPPNSFILTVDPLRLQEFKQRVEQADDQYEITNPLGLLQSFLQSDVHNMLTEYAEQVMTGNSLEDVVPEEEIDLYAKKK